MHFFHTKDFLLPKSYHLLFPHIILKTLSSKGGKVNLNKFIYILNHKYYKEYLDQGIYRFIPDKLLYKFERKIKPRIVCNFQGENDENIRGYGIGVALLNIEDDKNKFIERLIEGVKAIKVEGVNRIILDDILLLDNNDVIKIQESCNMKIVNGRKTLLELAPKIITEICKKSGKDIKNQEFLIIGDDSKSIKKLALEMAREVNYLTIQGLDESCADDVADEILNETGLAIHNAYDANNRIHKYNFIVNLSNKPKIAINKMKKRAIVLDMGASRCLSYDIRGLRKDVMSVSDCVFLNTNELKCNNEKINFGKDLDSHIYEGITDRINKKDLVKIKIYPRTYTIKQACDIFLNGNSNKTKIM